MYGYRIRSSIKCGITQAPSLGQITLKYSMLILLSNMWYLQYALERSSCHWEAKFDKTTES